MRRIILIFEFVFMVLSMELNAQYHDANWLVSSGYMGQGSNTLIHFPIGGGPPQISSTTGTIPFNYANASISDANGNFLFFSNGIEVFDKNYQIIPGCITQTPYTIQMAAVGLNRYNAGLFLPWPDDTNKYILFYCVPEVPVINTGSCPGGYGWLFSHLYYTVLDKSLNGGSGGKVSANNSVYIDTLVHLGGLAAVQHANGRDWWVLTKQRCSSNFNILLFTPSGIQQTFVQSVGQSMSSGLNFSVARFSHDGSTLIISSDDTIMNLYKFDRCNGVLYDPQIVNTSPKGEIYTEFSLNSRLLYKNSEPQGLQTAQYDLNFYYQPITFLNNRKYIDPVIDTASCGQGAGSASSACFPSLAPDGKIYWGHCYTCNLSVINYPDSLDTLCNMEYNTIQLPMPHSGALPQFPNFKLGPVIGSICDSLTLISELNNISVSMYPSPVEEKLTITSQKLLQNVSIHLFDQMGRLVLDQNFSSGTVFQINIPSYIRSGLYVVQIHSEKGNVSRKVIVQK